MTGFDSTILPNDFMQSGQILDDEIKMRTVAKFTGNVQFLFWSDSCYSGTVLDLPLVPESVSQSGPVIVDDKLGVWAASISGCTDNQTAADAYIQSSDNFQVLSVLLCLTI